MGVDVARGIAVIGMIGAHVGVTQTFDWARIETWTDVVNGRSALLFALLAGVSVALMSGGATIPSRDRLPRLRLQLVGRGAAVFAIGLVLELLNTGVAVILSVYGVLFVAVIPFLALRRRTLWILAAALAVAGPPLLEAARLLSLGASGPGLDLALLGTYPVTVWLALMLAGLAVGRSDLLAVRTAVVLLIGGVLLAAAGYGTATLLAPQDAIIGGSSSSSSSAGSGGSGPGAAGSTTAASVPISEIAGSRLLCHVEAEGYAVCYPEGVPDPLAAGGPTDTGAPYLEQVLEADVPASAVATLTDVEPHSGGTLEIIGSAGLGAAVLGLCLLVSRPVRWLLLPVAALGSMPLTSYSAHVVAILVAGGLDTWLVEGNAFWLVLSAALLAATTLWAVFLGAGPLERLTRRAADSMALVRRPSTRTP
ncbi:uncharacterized protein DUF418 [Rathayibacter tanaceti]|uniref:DUF1624 domain-containing protein n=3 Tax=Rathayibacter tanaceti TaxID=1671680 RepID=A0A166HS09_9MICO|nr:hypothetical protein ACH61_01777 [Rathayibacter tanaceti]QHC57011.1 DUF1624 domain-containing protein [Rathayibacter tanaceti]TCO39499.1 uncharacterized protein DUF418 [Rathayibacter tanaceti]